MDIERISEVTSDTISAVYSLWIEVIDITYTKNRRERFSFLVGTLQPDALWLLTVCCWFCMYNNRFNAIESSNYYSLPLADTNTSTFGAFVAMIRGYTRKNVSSYNEGALIKFLMTCDSKHRDFYLLLLSKEFIHKLPIYSVQLSLDVSGIRASALYGDVEPESTGLSGLNYPVGITGVPTPELDLYIIYRAPNRKGVLKQEGSEFIPVYDHFMTDELNYINTPRFAVAGFISAVKRSLPTFHPFDMLPSKTVYNKSQQTAVAEYQERLTHLRRFLDSNLLTRASTSYVGSASSSTEFRDELAKVISESPHQWVAITDSQSYLTGSVHVLPVSITFGIIEDYWIDEGTPSGFQVWFNGQLFKVSFSFVGKNNSLLNSIGPLRGKLLEFYYLKLDEYRLGIYRSVLWDKAPWRPHRLRGTSIHIEKCALCGGTDYIHANRGFCVKCESHMYYFSKKYGYDTWIPPGYSTGKTRKQNSWECSLLNTMNYKFKGTTIIAREDGYWMFKSKEESVE